MAAPLNGPRTTDIEPGDLVTYIGGHVCHCGVCGNAVMPMKKGQYYRVEDVAIVNDKPGLILDLPVDTTVHLRGFAAEAFRKVKPATGDFAMMLKNLSREDA